MSRRLPFSLLILVVLTLISAGAAAAAGGAWVELGGQRFTVEVAADDHSRMRGLMFRDALPTDAGMLFVFEHEQPLAFWMKNTRIPLDILYFDAAGRLVSTALDTPPCVTAYCPSYPSERPARFTLEINAGRARALGVQPGDRLRFSPGIPGAPLD